MRVRVASRAELEARARRVRQPPHYTECQWCAGPMPEGRRSNARYCRPTCRVLASRAIRGRGAKYAARVALSAVGLEGVNPATFAGPADPLRAA